MHEVLVEGLGSNGDGVARLDDGRVVFVDGALPGDRVRIEVVGKRKSVQHAALVEILEPSSERVMSRCKVDRCGGCILKSYSGPGQAEAKRARVVETLRRIGHLDVERLLGPVRQFGDGWGYRHRVRLHASWRERNGRGAGWEVGYHVRRSHEVISLAVCPVLAPRLEQVSARVAARLATLPRHAELHEVELAYSRRDDRVAMRIRAGGPVAPLRQAGTWLEEVGLSGVEVETPRARLRLGNLELRYDHARADGFDLRFEPAVFTQAHPLANDRLVDAVIAAVRPREGPRVLELHAGIGNFSLPLARAGARLVAVEQGKRAVLLGRRNARRAGLPIHFIEGSDVEAAVAGVEAGVAGATPDERWTPADVDVVLMDPPRTGAAEVARALAEGGPRRIVYVSCDPATFARDAAMWSRRYTLTHIEAYDMFPQTPHVEVLAAFSRSA